MGASTGTRAGTPVLAMLHPMGPRVGWDGVYSDPSVVAVQMGGGGSR